MLSMCKFVLNGELQEMVGFLFLNHEGIARKIVRKIEKFHIFFLIKHAGDKSAQKFLVRYLHSTPCAD